MKKLHVMLTADNKHKKLFPEIPTIDIKNYKNLKEWGFKRNHIFIILYISYIPYFILNLSLVECGTFSEQYTGSTVITFQNRESNYKNEHHNFRKKNVVLKEALRGAPKLYFMDYSCAVIFFFKYFFGTLVFHLYVFYVFSVWSEFWIRYRIDRIITFI